MKFNRTTALLSIAAFCFIALAVALISQHVFNMPPCAWCVLQRLIFLVIGLIALLCALAPKGLQTIGLGASLGLSISGIAAAWYQYTVASAMLSCDMTFADRFIKQIQVETLAPWFFGIYATCMDAAVSVLGVEYALWSLALFALLGVISLIALLRK